MVVFVRFEMVWFGEDRWFEMVGIPLLHGCCFFLGVICIEIFRIEESLDGNKTFCLCKHVFEIV